jgi:5-methylcytosine-specific restriction protein A
MSYISAQDFEHAFNNIPLSTTQQKILYVLYWSPENATTSRIIAANLDLNYSQVNLAYGKTGRQIIEFLNIPETQISFSSRRNAPRFWSVLSEGHKMPHGFEWALKPEVVTALGKMEWIQQQTDFSISQDLSLNDPLFEGSARTHQVITYERNNQARTRCIEHYGTVCAVCNFDFEKVYGPIGKGYVHVHHLTPVANIAETYQVDPIKDLRPVCPNCHAMLHRSNPPYTIEELQAFMRVRN